MVKAEELGDRFEISLRTVYRDVKALMEAGVPIGSEAGKGYFIVDGYHLPPVMFSQEEASAILLAGKMVEKMTDRSVKQAFESALLKIKSVLNDSEKDRLELLQSHIEVQNRPHGGQPDFPNRFLTDIQKAVVQREAIQIEYFSNYNDQITKRMVEPIGLFYYSSAWHLIAWCQLRNDYRDFRADRIKDMVNTGRKFDNRNHLSLKEYLKTVAQSNRDVEKAIVIFEKSVAKHVCEQRHWYGFAAEEDLGDKVRMTFLTGYIRPLARWLLMFGTNVTIEAPEKLKEIMAELVEELSMHYNTPSLVDR